VKHIEKSRYLYHTSDRRTYGKATEKNEFDRQMVHLNDDHAKNMNSTKFKNAKIITFVAFWNSIPQDSLVIISRFKIELQDMDHYHKEYEQRKKNCRKEIGELNENFSKFIR
jgi:hypothetical protein